MALALAPSRESCLKNVHCHTDRASWDAILVTVVAFGALMWKTCAQSYRFGLGRVGGGGGYHWGGGGGRRTENRDHIYIYIHRYIFEHLHLSLHLWVCIYIYVYIFFYTYVFFRDRWRDFVAIWKNIVQHVA